LLLSSNVPRRSNNSLELYVEIGQSPAHIKPLGAALFIAGMRAISHPRPRSPEMMQWYLALPVKAFGGRLPKPSISRPLLPQTADVATPPGTPP
jgi:hypothetical protein